ncbi:MAG: hypothetical protein MUE47_07315, partial [Acidobacteria bacterium]|nr:hypothetical protein [Acidobacteriota bacterium]
MKRAWILTFLSVLVLSAVPALAADGTSLSLLPWDDTIARDVRGGVRSALEKEKTELEKQKNAKDRPFVRVFTNEGIEIVDGKPTSFVTIQRSLDDKMVTERWRYTLEKSGADYVIKERTKVAEVDDAFPRLVEAAASARTAPALAFEHDLLKISGEAGGRFSVMQIGPYPDGVLWAGKGRLTLTPVNDQEAQFFVKQLDKRSIDTEIEALEIRFQPGDERFLKLFGIPAKMAGAAPSGKPAGGSGGDQLSQMISKVTISEDQLYTPYAYEFLPRPEYAGTFSIRAKTKDHGWIQYSFSSQPQLPQAQVWVAKEGANASLSRDTRAANDKIISLYPGPELRAMPRQQMERIRGLRDVTPLRFEAMLDLAPDRFSAQVDVDLQTLLPTRDLYFFLAGNPSVRSVSLEGAGNLAFVPLLNFASTVYGFEESANVYRVLLPEEVPAGTILRLRVAFDSPKLVRVISDGFWYV